MERERVDGDGPLKSARRGSNGWGGGKGGDAAQPAENVSLCL